MFKNIFRLGKLQPIRYKEGQYDKIVNLFIDNGLLSEHGIIVMESDHVVLISSTAFHRRRDYDYGENKVAILWR